MQYTLSLSCPGLQQSIFLKRFAQETSLLIHNKRYEPWLSKARGPRPVIVNEIREALTVPNA